MKPITLIFPFYQNQDMLWRQLAFMAEYAEDIKKNLRLIVVDDGSPEPARMHGYYGYDMELYRFDVDIRWGWLQARNLGVERANTKWVLLTDIDHMVPEATMRLLMEDKHNGKFVYRFRRVDAPDMTPYKEHPNSWFLTKDMFNRIGGYDERYLGFYGTDCVFRDAVNANSAGTVMLEAPLIRVPREVVKDASTTTYGRKEEQDRINVRRIRTMIAGLPPDERRPARAGNPWRQVEL